MLTGDFGKLARLEEKLLDVARVAELAEEKASKAVAAQLEHQYASGTDPDNEAWAELAPATIAKGRHEPPLTDKGIMRANTMVAKGARGLRGFTVSVNRPGKSPQVPALHQAGTENMPAREIVPREGEPLSKASAWDATVRVACGEAVVEHFDLGRP